MQTFLNAPFQVLEMNNEEIIIKDINGEELNTTMKYLGLLSGKILLLDHLNMSGLLPALELREKLI